MGRVRSETGLRTDRRQAWKGSRGAGQRRIRRLSLAIEALELRTLLAVLPASLVGPLGNASPTSLGPTATIDATSPVAPRLILLSDTGSSSNDGVTSTNNSATNPDPPDPPVFNVLDVAPRSTVVLYRNGLEVARLSSATGGTVTIADLNGESQPGQAPIPDGIYLYKVRQIDEAGNLGPFSDDLAITIDHTAPLAPSPPVLETDSDTSHGFAHTTKNNGAGPQDLPVFDVPAVEPGASVILYRAPVMDGIVGTFVRINALSATAGGTVAIADINQADPSSGTPGPEIPDGTYVYRARQIDLAGNMGPMSANSGIITIDTTAPIAPPVLRLDPASDTGISHDDAITQITLSGSPVFDISGVEGYSLVRLYRLAPGEGTATLVGSVFAPGGSTPVDVRITDVSSSTPDGTYIYTAQQIDQAGNVSAMSSGIRVIYDTSQPPTPGAAALDPASQTGGSDPLSTSVRTPTFHLEIAAPGAQSDLLLTLLRDGQIVYQGPLELVAGTNSVTITDPGPVSDGVHTYQTFLTDSAGNTSLVSDGISITFAPDAPGVPALDPSSDSGTQGDGITNHTTNLLFQVPVASPSRTVQLYRDDQLVGTRNGPGPIADIGPGLTAGTHRYTTRQIDEFGTVSEASDPLIVTIIPQVGVPTEVRLGVSSDSGTKGDGVTNVTRDLSFDVLGVTPGATVVLLRDGVAVRKLTGTAGGTVAISDPGPLGPGAYSYAAEQIDQGGNTSAASPSMNVRIVTSAAAPASPTLLASSDTGMIGDNVTGARNPVFDVSGVPSDAALSLLRDGVVVNTIPGGAGGTVAIGDPGPLLNGQHTYAALVTDGAGNVSPAGAPLILSIVTVRGDYDGDGKADFAVFRRVSPAQAQWFVSGTSALSESFMFGSGTLDVPFQGDIDGDGRTDLILYRPSTSHWYVQQSSLGYADYAFGGPGDLPVVGDFDGLGHDELAVYRPSTGQWFVAGHAGAYATFGGPEDIPVPLRNYYGSGHDVLAVYRPSTSEWFVAGQGAGINFGGVGDIPMPLFNFYGNGRDALAVFRPSTSTWYVAGQGSGISFGGSGDVAVAADFDGLGHDELAVYRPGTGEWFVGGHGAAVATFGGSSDIPLAAPYVYRVLPGMVSPLSSPPSGSASPLDLGGNVLAPGIGATQTTVTKPVSPAANVPATPPSTRPRRPNQKLSVPRAHPSGLALAPLKRRGKSPRMG